MRYKKVAVGGTFDHFHAGHKALLDKAFELGDNVLIGLTSDAYSKGESESYSARKRNLETYLKGKNYEIVKLEDAYGPAIADSEIDAIVVSSETKPRALEINDIRHKRGLSPLEIIVIPMVMAANGRRISSTRIRKGEIDNEGRVI
jgi:pantetheine-phosphate adenylyltransferase